MKEEILKILEKILDGIDKDEVEYENGWWETSIGAKLGTQKKKEIMDFFSSIEIKNPNAVALGSIKTLKKAKSSRKNGKLGGRPRLTPLPHKI